jgi:hypothetical protein
LFEHLTDAIDPELPSHPTVVTETDVPSAVDRTGRATALQPVEPSASIRMGEEGQLSPIAKPASGQVALREPAIAVRQDGPPAANLNRVSVDETDTLRLMHDLNSADDEIRGVAASELLKAGFSEVHLELAQRLTSPTADVRAAVADQLPVTPGIDAKVWLTWLLRDDSAEVRLAALAVLATTGQSDTLRRAMEIARQDRDPRIHKLLEQLEKQR